MQNNKLSVQQFICPNDGIHRDAVNIRAILKAKAHNIRKSYFKISASTKNTQKSSLIFLNASKKMETQIIPPNQKQYPKKTMNHPFIQNSPHEKIATNFIDMFAKISKQTKQQYKRNKSLKSNAIKKQNKVAFENSLVVEKINNQSNHKEVSFRKFSYRSLSHKKQSKSKENSRFNYKDIPMKIKRGSNFSRKRLSTLQNLAQCTGRSKVKTQGNYCSNKINEQASQFQPLGNLISGYQNFFNRNKNAIQYHNSFPLQNSQQVDVNKSCSHSDNQQNQDILSRRAIGFHTKRSSLKSNNLNFQTKNKLNKTYHQSIKNQTQKHWRRQKIGTKSGPINPRKRRAKSHNKKYQKTIKQPQVEIYQGFKNTQRQMHGHAGHSFGPWVQ